MNPYERLVVVGNPVSSAAGAIRRQVVDRLDSEGFRPLHVDLPSAAIDDVTEEFDSRLRAGDRVLVAGGDGTYYLAINALRQLTDLRRTIDVGFMAYGNRCDGANYSGRFQKNAVAMAGQSVVPRTFRPLRHRLLAPGTDVPTHDRLAVSYVTFGDALAPGAEIFNTDENRQRMHGATFKLLHSAHIAAGYLAKRLKAFDTLPEGTRLNGEMIGPDTTDIVALHGLTMAGVLKNRQKTYDPQHFESVVLAGNTIHVLGSTVTQGLLRGIPSRTVSDMLVEFPTPVDMTLQADGEASHVDNIHMIVVDKPEDESLQVLMPRSIIGREG